MKYFLRFIIFLIPSIILNFYIYGIFIFPNTINFINTAISNPTFTNLLEILFLYIPILLFPPLIISRILAKKEKFDNTFILIFILIIPVYYVIFFSQNPPIQNQTNDFNNKVDNDNQELILIKECKDQSFSNNSEEYFSSVRKNKYRLKSISNCESAETLSINYDMYICNSQNENCTNVLENGNLNFNIPFDDRIIEYKVFETEIKDIDLPFLTVYVNTEKLGSQEVVLIPTSRVRESKNGPVGYFIVGSFNNLKGNSYITKTRLQRAKGVLQVVLEEKDKNVQLVFDIDIDDEGIISISK
ncbi:hypothetical protein CO178_02000 [candidate division WWE3 bacterium CG_4_9_14_3_um_filter_34_6]|uniref:Uncharacterized protein n=1 Tax=candidate division WWE3 bacterium CG_4_9_14_3_um_filter_34_6 TaxID=1975079 RepID=A0A2M7X319_UNCKA|nr:MAG: hypothetical protein CO178_02000 [candidate division WWE3 bacterium CG_4_9_14_3_um_filter_34_6]